MIWTMGDTFKFLGLVLVAGAFVVGLQLLMCGLAAQGQSRLRAEEEAKKTSAGKVA